MSNIYCPECEVEMERTDTTFSNINTHRAYAGQHTGNIYYCKLCESTWLENLLNDSNLERWGYL